MRNIAASVDTRSSCDIMNYMTTKQTDTQFRSLAAMIDLVPALGGNDDALFAATWNLIERLEAEAEAEAAAVAAKRAEMQAQKLEAAKQADPDMAARVAARRAARNADRKY